MEANSFLRELFLQRLPANVRMVLASVDASMSLEKLADMADKVLEVATPSVAAIQNPDPVPAADSSEVALLRQEVTRLAALIESMSPRSRSRTPKSRHPATPTPSPAPQESLCWYHTKFGAGATKCKEPCSWTLNSMAGH